MAGKQRLSLSERLAAATQPRPVDFDPEDVSYDDGTKAESHYYGEFATHNGGESAPRSSMRIRTDNIELDEKFAGRTVSRHNLDSSEESSSEELEGYGSAEDLHNTHARGASAKQNYFSEDDVEDRTDEEMALKPRIDQFGSSSDEEDMLDDHDGSGSEWESDTEDKRAGPGNAPVQKSVFEKMGGDLSDDDFAAEDAETEKQMRVDRVNEQKKSVHTKNQKLLWEDFLETRILLQRVLADSNKIPQGNDFNVLMKDDQVQEQLESVRDAVSETFESMLDIEHTLADSFIQRVGADSSLPVMKGSRKRPLATLAEAWEELNELRAVIGPYADSVTDSWSKKTQLASGVHLKKKLKVLNQSVASQVDGVLADEKRFKRRAYARKGQYAVISLDSSEQSSELDVTVEENGSRSSVANGVEQGSRQENVEESGARDAADEPEFDENIYDDISFYELLIKEFIEASTGGVERAAQRRARGTRRNVDRRATKGRKIKYVVHPKLQNFMYPEAYPKPLMDVDELFNSLFGKKVAAPS